MSLVWCGASHITTEPLITFDFRAQGKSKITLHGTCEDIVCIQACCVTKARVEQSASLQFSSETMRRRQRQVESEDLLADASQNLIDPSACLNKETVTCLLWSFRLNWCTHHRTSTRFLQWKHKYRHTVWFLGVWTCYIRFISLSLSNSPCDDDFWVGVGAQRPQPSTDGPLLTWTQTERFENPITQHLLFGSFSHWALLGGFHPVHKHSHFRLLLYFYKTQAVICKKIKLGLENSLYVNKSFTAIQMKSFHFAVWYWKPWESSFLIWSVCIEWGSWK